MRPFYLILFFGAVLIFPFYQCTSDHSSNNNIDGKKLMKKYCSTCHLPSNPASLPKNIWVNSVLPQMSWYLGIRSPKANPLKGLSSKELELIDSIGLFPNEPIIDSSEWSKLKDYIINLAPDSIAFENSRLERSVECKQFSPFPFSVDNKPGGKIISSAYNPNDKTLWFGDIENNIIQLTPNGVNVHKGNSPTVKFNFLGKKPMTTEIGKLFPHDEALGSISTLDDNNKIFSMASNLQRPVQSEVKDLNNDGTNEIVIAEYGNFTGGLSYLDQDGNKNRIINKPGCVRFFIDDVNSDGLKDIVCLFAQGDECVMLFTQKRDFTFESKYLLRFPPEYGSTDFIWIDIDKDGDKDIITAHGDNADFTYFSKPYHGVRIHLNNNFAFSLHHFIPIYGATNLLVYDYDEDGDYDIAVNAFFPSFEKLYKESFIYLENKSLENNRYGFQYLESDIYMRSLSFTMMDYDGDLDQDLILSLFDISPQVIPKDIENRFKNAPYDFVVLSNTLKNNN